MRKSGNSILNIILAICFGVFLSIYSGCAGKKPQERNGKATIQYITKDNRMERVLFDEGFLRSTPEITSGTIVANVYKGSQGMMYGKRFINGMYWAKVTTREGITGWYSAGDKEGKPANTDLSTSRKNYKVTYPVIGGIDQSAAGKINKEITDYLTVFKYVAGPVGNTLQCRVTYNKDNLLSIVFTASAIRGRAYKVADVNNIGFWSNVNKFCFIPDLYSDADKVNLVAPLTDLQYAMVFSLVTGQRLSEEVFLEKKQEDRPADCFYIEQGKKLWAYVDSKKQPEQGRKLINLSSLVTKDY